MMCWEHTESLAEKEYHEEPEKMANKHVETTEKPKHEEEHVEPTLNTGNRLKISIEEFSWEREGGGSTLGTERTYQTTEDSLGISGFSKLKETVLTEQG